MIKQFSEDWKRHKVSGTRVLFALTVYRFGRWAASIKFTPFRKLFGVIYIVIQPVSALLGGMYLYRDTKIGEEPHFIHGGNIQISPAAKIGDRVGIAHGVTIGTNMTGGSPKIGNDVFVGVNSTVLGAITIGDRVTIASNTAVTTNVPSDSIAVGSPAKVYARLSALGAAKAAPE